MKNNNTDKLVEEILRARTRIYKVNKPTPLDNFKLDNINANIYLKREDLSSINAYKWRGAYNAITMLNDEDLKKGVVAASAGNHAQGVAISAKMLKIPAKIYMPKSTPKIKQKAVEKHGGGYAEIILTGDTYNEASDAALKYASDNNISYIHPFDNLYTIAGQATIADEVILSGVENLDYAFIQIGGGGMIAGMCIWLKIHYPNIKIIGIEGDNQDSMKQSLEQGKLVTLDEVDRFCDGTAVRTPGKLCFEFCQGNVDEVITVSNEDICYAIEKSWENGHFIPEPSGAMGIAGIVKYAEKHDLTNKNLLTVVSGSNMDFSKLRVIASNSAIGSNRQKYFRFEIGEKNGSLLELINKYFADINISSFQYGKTSDDKAFPVIAFDAEPKLMVELKESLDKDNINFSDITGDADIQYRIINYNSSSFKNPIFMHIDFAEREGALRELLKNTSKISNICYFNYFYTGEVIGRALMGFEFNDKSKQDELINIVSKSSVKSRLVDREVLERLIM